jgi:hypothetical protein
MIRRKQVLEFVQKGGERLAAWLEPFAFPGHGIELPPVFIAALPKSGSIYIQRALRRSLQVTVGHIATSGLSGSSFRHSNLLRFRKGNVVSREHLQPRAFLVGLLAAQGVDRMVVHVRDPRAAIVSWARHMDRNLTRRGLWSVALSCERQMPSAYQDWEFDQRLRWQIENMLPAFVAWIEGWLELAATCPEMKFLITDYLEFARENRAFIEKLLTFYDIPFRADWIKMPERQVGKNNIRSDPGAAVSIPAELSALAISRTPAHLRLRFGWE